MAIRKPKAVADDPYKSAKWDELTAGRSLGRSDAPALALLCQWHKVADAAVEELDGFGGQTAYTDESGELRAFPQISTLKTASAEIRQLNKQLGISGEPERAEPGKTGGFSVLELAMDDRRKRERAAG